MSAAPRFALFAALWLVLSDAALGGLPFGLLAAGLATRASLVLLPGPMTGSPRAGLRLAGRVAWQALLGGVDVARRAFSPAMPLRPGLVRLVPAQAPGAGRDVFCALASLAPGSLPAGLDGDGLLMVHALDTGLDVAGDLAGTEALCAEAFRG